MYGVAGRVFGRARYEPGWRWSAHVGAPVGAALCHVAHVGIVLSGRAAVQMHDGPVVEIGRGDWFDIPPGHDSWVIGDEDYVSLHVLGADGYAADPTDGRSTPAATASTIVSSAAVASQAWGEGCRSWLLLNRPSLHVMEEQMPPRSKERRHVHSGVEQFYYVLRGSAVVSLGDTAHPMSAGQGAGIAPGVVHQIRNDSDDSLRLLVISSAAPQEDRADDAASTSRALG